MTSTEADVVPFCLQHVLEEIEDTDLCKLLLQDEWVEEFGTNQRLANISSGQYEPVLGWTYTPSNGSYGKRGRLLAQRWANGNNNIYIFNSHEASGGGGIDMTVCANDQASLDRFKNDFGVGHVIEKDEAITQTL